MSRLTSTGAATSSDGRVTVSDGVVTGGPRRWLRLEAAALLGATLVGFSTTHQPWWLVPVLLLVPDVAMVGYLGGGTRLGAHLYNLVHATPLPTAMVGLAWWQHQPLALALALGLVWLAHIGMDRLLGYGLKYDDHFRHTHLGMVGAPERHP